MTEDLKKRLREWAEIPDEDYEAFRWLDLLTLEAADRIEQLEAECDELKADAMRYRWLPVEIVPKTEEILLVSHIFNNKICWAQAARQKHGVWFSPTGHAVHQPTHWMSLPKPPTLAKGESHES